MSYDLSTVAPLIALLGIFLGLAPSLDRTRDTARAAMALLVFALGARYIAWRLDATVLPLDGTPTETVWVWTVFAVELLAFAEVTVFLLIMSRTSKGRALADRRQAELAAGGRWPSVDVFIPTYNEGLEVLEKSIVGARAMDYPDFRVHVLDDGRRGWLRDFCRAKGVNYITRPDNAHAKAGNMNNALARTDGELVAVFDADFVPHRNFLRRTVGMFADPAVGIVQTPQHFFNKDPVQMNLRIAKDWPDEQRLFFDEMATSRDAWDAAFCCGSCSVMRRAALEAIGGVPTASITEDLLTTLAMRRAGYVTRYLNEKLSQGLAAEGLNAFFIQRARWCQGGIQTIFLKEGPLGPGVGLLHRILFFPTSWVIQYLVRAFALLVPIVYLLGGLIPLHYTTLGDLIYYQAPTLLAYFWAMRWFVGGKYVPVLSTAVGVFATFRLLPTVIASLIRPFGRPFRVTPKGALNRAGADWISFAAIMAVAGLTALGLVVNSLPGLQLLTDRQFFPVAAAWALVNLVILLLASLICFDVPRKRREERFHLDVAAEVTAADAGGAGWISTGRVTDLSLAGARLELPAERGVPERLSVRIPDGPDGLTGRVVRADGTSLTLAFDTLPEATRDALIAHLFSGAFDTQPPRTAYRPALLRNLWQRFAGPAAA